LGFAIILGIVVNHSCANALNIGKSVLPVVGHKNLPLLLCFFETAGILPLQKISIKNEQSVIPMYMHTEFIHLLQ
jgi:hypothetical protein